MLKRTCDACGFEDAELDKPCPLCGAREAKKIAHVDALVARELASRQPTRDLKKAAPVDATERVGQVFAGRYRIDALIGAGGMGQVFRARDTREHRDLALKVLHPSREEDPERTERIEREVSILSRIKHPAVLAIMDFGVHESELFFVSELVDGTDLRTEMKRRGLWNPIDATALAASVADALSVAHAVGVVHRDVKPSNIMLGRDGSVKLLDFAHARGVGIDVAAFNRPGTSVGAPSYMSPEQFDTHGVDERSDIYSLGVVLFEMLTGKLPFTGQTPSAIALKHKIEPAPAPRALRPELPAWIDRVVVRCLQKDPAHRFQTASDLSKELRSRGTGPHLRPLPGGDAKLQGASPTALRPLSDSDKTDWVRGLGSKLTRWMKRS